MRRSAMMIMITSVESPASATKLFLGSLGLVSGGLDVASGQSKIRNVGEWM